MPETIGRRQKLNRNDDVFGGNNPYSTISLRDEFGSHCQLQNPENEPLRASVTSIHWGDDPELPDDVREWFVERNAFGLIARVEGLQGGEDLGDFLGAADLRVLMTADGKPTLGVGFDPGCWWWKGDHALVHVPFGAGDRRDLVNGVDYRFAPRNEGEGAQWEIAEGLRIVRK